MKLKRILCIVFVLVLALSLTFAFSSCAVPQGLKTPGTVVIGLDATFPPMGYTDASGNIIGFDCDLAKAVFAKVGVTVQFQPIQWSNLVNELNTRKVDVIWNGVTITSERQSQLLMSDPYMNNKQVVMVPIDSAINSIDDLAGKNVVAQDQSTAVDAINASTVATTIKLTTLADNVTCMTELQQGKADAFVLDKVVADWMLTQGDNGANFRLLSDTMADEQYGVAVRKGNTDLMDMIEQGMDACLRDGTLAAISTQWFGSDVVIWTDHGTTIAGGTSLASAAAGS